MNCIKNSFMHAFNSAFYSRNSSVLPDNKESTENTPQKSICAFKHKLRLAAYHDYDMNITGIAWIIVNADEGVEIGRGTTTINSYSDTRYALYRAFEHGLHIACKLNINILCAETDNINFMTYSDHPISAYSKKSFKKIKKSISTYIRLHFKRVYYSVVSEEETKDIIDYIREYMDNFTEETKFSPDEEFRYPEENHV